MMKVSNIFKKASALFAAFALISVFVVAAQVSAVPYDPSHPGAQTPTFNMYTGTPSVGDESDFFKGKETGSTGYVNSVSSQCGNGQKFELRVYVHNGANQSLNNNGNGPGVAKNTKVKVQLPNSASDNFSLNSTISASNAASVNDGMTINCNGKVRRISYVAGSAKQYTVPGGNQALSDSIVTTGAPVGTQSPNGDVWGCWDQRVWVTLVVEVKDIPAPAQTAVCDLLKELVRTNRTVRVDDIDYTVTNGATFRNYSIEWGDGQRTNNVANLPQNHTFANDGTYTVKALVNVTVNGAERSVTSANCERKVTIETDSPDTTVCEYTATPPKTVTIKEADFDSSKHTRDLSRCVPATTVTTPPTPTVLPDTGVGSILGLFASLSAGGAIAHRLVWARRFGA